MEGVFALGASCFQAGGRGVTGHGVRANLPKPLREGGRGREEPAPGAASKGVSAGAATTPREEPALRATSKGIPGRGSSTARRRTPGQGPAKGENIMPLCQPGAGGAILTASSRLCPGGTWACGGRPPAFAGASSCGTRRISGHLSEARPQQAGREGGREGTPGTPVATCRRRNPASEAPAAARPREEVTSNGQPQGGKLGREVHTNTLTLKT